MTLYHMLYYCTTPDIGDSTYTDTYPSTEYVGHVASVECDFEPQQQCPWQLEAGTIINTQTGQHIVDRHSFIM